MKFLAVIFIFWSPMASQATMLVPAYNENYCPNIDTQVAVIRYSTQVDYLFESLRLLGIVNQWNKAFKEAGDLVLSSNTTPLCVGLMDDKGQPNAAAVGKYFLLMGTSLITMLEEQNGKNTIEKSVKEKFVLAHEYAHVIQNLHGLEFDYILPMLSTKFKEQHADCMASFMLSLNSEIPDDQSLGLEAFIEQLADAHIVGDHGTKEQRIAAYRTGLGLGSIQKIIYGRNLSQFTTSQLILGCGEQYRPTNLLNKF